MKALLKKLLTKIKSIPKNNAGEGYVSIRIAHEAGLSKAIAFIATIFLVFGLTFSFQSLKSNKTLKAMAAGSGIGSRIFCGTKPLCSNGRCEGEIWQDCSGCPLGSSQTIMQITCTRQIKSDCARNNSICKN